MSRVACCATRNARLDGLDDETRKTVLRFAFLQMPAEIVKLKTKEQRRAAIDSIEDPMYRDLAMVTLARLWKKRFTP